MRGDRKKQVEGEKEKRESWSETIEDSKVIDIRNYKPKRISQLMWCECIKKVWEADPLTCLKCTGEMKIISFIYNMPVINKILTHLAYTKRSAISEHLHQHPKPIPGELK